MAGRPDIIAHLRKGELIDTVDGFVDSWNFVADSMHNLKGGEGIAIDWQDGTHPIVNATGGGGGTPQFEGTDGSETDDNLSGNVKFASAEDSNVIVTCAGDTITIGVYYV